MTPRELEVLDLVRDRVTIAGFAPTVEEIRRHLGLASKSSAARLVDALERQGKLTRERGKVRGLQPADAPDLRLASTDAIVAELRRRGKDVASRPAPAIGRRASCAADTCGAAVQVGHLFCRSHYFMLPERLRTGLIATRRAGETARFEQLLTQAKDIADGLTPEARARRVG